MVEAMMVAARIQRSRWREIGGVTMGSIRVLFMASGTLGCSAG
jgi:hypothetical protein